MITNIKLLEKYCTDYTKIENYEEALHSHLKYDLHHRREISENKSRKQLIAENLYYGRPPEELIFFEHSEHIRLHNLNLSEETRQKMSDAKKGKPGYWKGKHPSVSQETRQKISEAKKGHHCSEEARKKMSDARKGRHWHLENGRRIYTD